MRTIWYLKYEARTLSDYKRMKVRKWSRMITYVITLRNTSYKLCGYNLYILCCFMYCIFANSYAYRNLQIFLERIGNYLEGNHRDWHWLLASCTPRGSLLFIKTSTATSGITESGWSRSRGYDMVRRAWPTTRSEYRVRRGTAMRLLSAATS